MRTPIFIGLAIGAFFGAMIGAMFDSLLHPGLPTLYGIAAGMVVGAVGLVQLHRCDPFRRFHDN